MKIRRYEIRIKNGQKTYFIEKDGLMKKVSEKEFNDYISEIEEELSDFENFEIINITSPEIIEIIEQILEESPLEKITMEKVCAEDIPVKNIEIFDEGDSYTIVLDICGIPKKDIKINTKQDEYLILELIYKKDNEKKYFPLPFYKIKEPVEKPKLMYNNGILSIKLKKKKK